MLISLTIRIKFIVQLMNQYVNHNHLLKQVVHMIVCIIIILKLKFKQYFVVTPATDVPAGAKCGYLEKKERIFFIGLQKKFYAFAYQNWMVMYYSKKDSKPITTLNLTQYEAKKLEGPKDKKEMFQLSCLNDQTKTYIVR